MSGDSDLSIEGKRVSASLAWVVAAAFALFSGALWKLYQEIGVVDENLSGSIAKNKTDAQTKFEDQARAITALQLNQAAANVITAAQVQKDVQEIKLQMTKMNTQLEDIRERRGRGD